MTNLVRRILLGVAIVVLNAAVATTLALSAEPVASAQQTPNESSSRVRVIMGGPSFQFPRPPRNVEYGPRPTRNHSDIEQIDTRTGEPRTRDPKAIEQRDPSTGGIVVRGSTPSAGIPVPGGAIQGPVFGTQVPTAVRFQDPNQVIIRPMGPLAGRPNGAPLYLATLVAFVGIGTVAMLLIPRRLQRVSNVLSGGALRFLRFLAIGSIGLVSIGALLYLVELLVYPFSFVGVVFPLVAIGLVTGLIAVSLGIGNRLARWSRLGPRWLVTDFALGALVLTPFALLPVAGWFISGVAAALGLGAVVYTRFGGEGWSSLRVAE